MCIYLFCHEFIILMWSKLFYGLPLEYIIIIIIIIVIKVHCRTVVQNSTK